MARNPVSTRPRRKRRSSAATAPASRRFSLGWVVVSYFLVCGGLCAAAGAYAATGTRDPNVIRAALFVGAAVGGCIAGRASPHRSYLEPALAAALVVGSVALFVYSTPMGKILVAQHRDKVIDTALWLGGLGSAGGFLGAVVGEATQPRAPAALTLRWLVISLFIATGALFATSTAAAILLLNDAAEAALLQMWTGGIDPTRPILNEERVIISAALSGASAAFITGLVTQMAAPRRALVPAAFGALAVTAAAVVAVGWAVGRAAEMIGPAAFFGAVAAALSLAGAIPAYLAGRASGRLSGAVVSANKRP